MEKRRKYAGFGVELKTGSKRKQRLSNNLKIHLEDGRSEVALKLTLRQALALRKFLNETLDNS